MSIESRLLFAVSLTLLSIPALLSAQSVRDSVALGRAVAAELTRGDTSPVRIGTPAAPNAVTEAFARALRSAPAAPTVATIMGVRLGRDTARVALRISSQARTRVSEGEGEYRAVRGHGRWRAAVVLPWREATGEIVAADSSKRRAPICEAAVRVRWVSGTGVPSNLTLKLTSVRGGVTPLPGALLDTLAAWL